jgi:hypothetical protein
VRGFWFAVALETLYNLFTMSFSVKTAQFIFLASLLFFVLPQLTLAAFIGQQDTFSIRKEYDSSGRETLSATLLKIGSKLYYYADLAWWNSLSQLERSDVSLALENLDREFSQRIYPTLTSMFGGEWNPGIDKDPVITLLLHPMVSGAGGYTNYGDEYPKVQNPSSNEREMMYLNASLITLPSVKTFLAHEFVHVITFNQKNIIRTVSEETWLNEARAEYAPALLGYEDEFEGSNLQRRAKDFLGQSGDALLVWEGLKYDYGVVNLFMQYIVDHYGVNVLKDSMSAGSVGVASISAALAKNGFGKTFAQVFVDWTIAVLVNDCNVGEHYCYLNPNLRSLRIVPQGHFLPLSGDNVLTTSNAMQDWSGRWFKIVGGGNTLKIEVQGDAKATFTIPYIVDEKGTISVRFLALDSAHKGVLQIPDFNRSVRSVTLIPSSQTETAEREDAPFYQFGLIISTVSRTQEQEEQALIEQMLVQIDFLKKKIAELQLELARVLASQGGVSCSQLTRDLSFGMRGDREVGCLQELLKTKEPGLYSEGLVTGNFFSLTQAAVIRFQEKYAQEILAPIGLLQGTGYVGSLTRKKLNQLF